MDRKRQLALVFATIGIALGAGHLVQGGTGGSDVAASPRPTDVDLVSAGPEVTAPTVTAGLVGGGATNAEPATAEPVVTADLSPPEPALPPASDLVITGTADAVTDTVPALVDIETDAGTLPVPANPAPQDIAVPEASVSGAGADPALRPAATFSGAASEVTDPADIPELTPELTPAPLPAVPVQSTPTEPAPLTPVQSEPAQDSAAADCPVTLKIAAAPQATIGISILAPCAPDARVLIDHMGLAVTGRTDDAGSLFLSIPALAVDATVTAYVADADAVSESLRIPSMSTLRRFGVQWQSKDAFQLHAFENGANYGDAGHLSAADPRTPLTGAPPAGGYLTMLGDEGVALPHLAQIYTFPANGAGNTDVLIEAAVTEATCGRAIEGETIMTLAGDAYVTPLTLAMPDCDGVGDILVLKNLMTDLTIAAAN